MILDRALSRLSTGYYVFYNNWYIYKLCTGWLLQHIKSGKIVDIIFITKNGERIKMMVDNNQENNQENSEDIQEDSQIESLGPDNDVQNEVDDVTFDSTDLDSEREHNLYEEGSVLDRIIFSIERLEDIHSDIYEESSELESILGVISGVKYDTNKIEFRGSFESVVQSLEKLSENAQSVKDSIVFFKENLTKETPSG